MPLYHFSEDGNIECFKPRAPLDFPEVEPHVWAIDEWHSPLYFLPRDCPRVGFWPLPTTSEADLEKSWAQATGRIVIAIESAWYERARTTMLYRYTFSESTFVSVEDHGVHVSKVAVEPISIEPMDDLSSRIVRAGVELRVCPSLVPLAKQLMETSIHWSLIRMRNAEGWDMPPGRPTLPEY